LSVTDVIGLLNSFKSIEEQGGIASDESFKVLVTPNRRLGICANVEG
jgi:hypothetical protein